MRTVLLNVTILLLVLFSGLIATATAQDSTPPYTISTIAGGALPPVPLQATAVSIGSPTGIAVDSAGNVYFSGPNVVFKLTPAGVLTRVAGTGAGGGYAGDGGPAIQSQLNFPRAFPYDGLDWLDIVGNLAIDRAGNLYIADMENDRVRKVGVDGIITTVPGPGHVLQAREPSGVAVDRNGDLNVVSPWANIWKVTASGEIVTVPGTGFGCSEWPTSRQCVPYSAAADKLGNLYIVDTGHCRVQRIGADGEITTVAGDGRSDPRGFAYRCEYSGDGGPATSAALNWPYGVAVDDKGNVYIADTGNHRIRKVSPDGIITTIAGTGSWTTGSLLGEGYPGDGGPATEASLHSPHGVAVDTNGNIYIADTENYRIRKVAADGTITTIAGNGLFNESGNGGPATSAQLNFIHGYVRGLRWGQGENWNASLISVDAVGNVNTLDAGKNRIRRIHPSGVIDTVAEPAATSSNTAVDGAGNHYVADCCRIQRTSPTGDITTVATFPPDPPYLKNAYGPLSCGSDLCGKTVIRSVAVGAEGNVYFSNATNVFRLSTDGTVTTIAGNGTYGYSGDGGPATAAQLSFPAGIALDDAGNIYIADAGNNAVRVLTLARQPASLSVRPTIVAQGECFTVTAENGSGMTLDVQYQQENGPIQTIRGWPVLDQDGASKICTDLNTAPGNYSFLSIRNTSNPGWVGVQTTVTVKRKP